SNNTFTNTHGKGGLFVLATPLPILTAKAREVIYKKFLQLKCEGILEEIKTPPNPQRGLYKRRGKG
ncbi:MAG: hypothetical protein ACQBVK_01480, partial [Candidatus Phytoplasma sp. TWB_XP]